jgi:hypothetical protein
MNKKGFFEKKKLYFYFFNHKTKLNISSHFSIRLQTFKAKTKKQ